MQHESQVGGGGGGGGGSGQSSEVHLKTVLSIASGNELSGESSDPYLDELQEKTTDR
jgi:hypothetical protein